MAFRGLGPRVWILDGEKGVQVGGPSLEAQLRDPTLFLQLAWLRLSQLSTPPSSDHQIVVVVASMRCKVIRGWREVKGEGG